MKKQDQREVDGPNVAEYFGDKISKLVEEGIKELSNKIEKKEIAIQTLQQNQENERKPLGKSLFFKTYKNRSFSLLRFYLLQLTMTKNKRYLLSVCL